MPKISLKSISRIQTMKILYIADMNSITIENSLKMCQSGIFEDDELLENKDLLDDTKELVEFINDNIEKIYNIIKKNLVNYTIDRLNFVDKAIIRVATAELLKGDLDKRIIINEAIEITKIYSDNGSHKAASFNNRLLDNISNNLS